MSNEIGATAEGEALERIVPWQLDPGDERQKQVLQIHEDRYRFAARYVRGKRVLDLACGVGYGSRILTEEGGAASVLGVDIDEQAVSLATEHFASPRTRFLCRSYQQVPREQGFDVVVSLETIEHLPDPADFLRFMRQVLDADGRLIGSVPITPTTDFNQYHLHDFTRRSITALLRRTGFRMTEERVQVEQVRWGSTQCGKKAGQQRFGLLRLVGRLLGFYAGHPLTLWQRIWATVRHGLDVHCLLFVATPDAPAPVRPSRTPG